MARILVKFFGTLRLELRTAEIWLDVPPETSLKGLLQELEANLADKGGLLREKLFQGENLRPGVIILKNGVNIYHLKGLSTPVQPNDILAIFPPGGGG